MSMVASSDEPLHSNGNMLVRTSYSRPGSRLVPGASPDVSGMRAASSQTMLRPFHSLENQCAAERRLKAERCAMASSKAGFMGQLRHLNFVQQRLQSMAPSQASAEPGSPEARLEVTAGERWSMLPGSAPPSLLSRPAVSSTCSRIGAVAGSRAGTLCKGGAGRRRRPVHVITPLEEDQPDFIDFDEDPEDPRVYLPAHRIGDLLPEAANQGSSPTPKKPQQQSQHARNGKPGISKSMPCLHIAARRLPLRPVRGAQGKAGYGGAGGGTSAKPMSRQREEAVRPLRPSDFEGFSDDGGDDVTACSVFPDPMRQNDDSDDEDFPD